MLWCLTSSAVFEMIHLLDLFFCYLDAHEYYAMFMTNSVPNPMDHSLEIHCISTSNENYVRLTTGWAKLISNHLRNAVNALNIFMEFLFFLSRRYINKRLARHEVEKNIIKEVILNRDEGILFTVPGHYRAQLSRSGYFDTQYKVWTNSYCN